MPVPSLIPVTSSNLHSVGHDATGLYVRFKAKDGPGPLWHYPHVTADEHAALIGAESIGRHYIAHIKAKHEGAKVGT